MSKNDNTERVLRDIHMMISKCPRYGEREIIVNRREILMLLDRLNYSIYDMMEAYEQTERSRASAEREVKRRGDGIIETASERAEDVYAAAMVFTADMLGRVQDMLDEAHESIGDMMSHFSEEINNQKHTVRRNQTEIESHLSEMHDTQKYLNLITDANKEIEREKARRARLKNVGRKTEPTASDDDIQIHEDSEYYRQWRENVAPGFEDQLDELDQIDLRMAQEAEAREQAAANAAMYGIDEEEDQEEAPQETAPQEVVKARNTEVPADAEVDALLAEIKLDLDDVEEPVEVAEEAEAADEGEESLEEEALDEAPDQEAPVEILEDPVEKAALAGDTVIMKPGVAIADTPQAPADFDGGKTINLSEAMREELESRQVVKEPTLEELIRQAEQAEETAIEAKPAEEEHVVEKIIRQVDEPAVEETEVIDFDDDAEEAGDPLSRQAFVEEKYTAEELGLDDEEPVEEVAEEPVEEITVAPVEEIIEEPVEEVVAPAAKPVAGNGVPAGSVIWSGEEKNETIKGSLPF